MDDAQLMQIPDCRQYLPHNTAGIPLGVTAPLKNPVQQLPSCYPTENKTPTPHHLRLPDLSLTSPLFTGLEYMVTKPCLDGSSTTGMTLKEHCYCL